jgi:hypothetical protein
MNYISFSTASDLELDVNVIGLPPSGEMRTSLALGLIPFPQMFPHQGQIFHRFFSSKWLAISTFPQALLLVLRIHTSFIF